MADNAFSLNRIVYFLKRGIWEEGNVRFRDKPAVYIAQRLYLVGKGLFVDNHWGYAAQLTFNTMMAIIPVVAVIFAVGRGFGFEDYIDDSIRRMFASQPTVATAIMDLARSYIKYTHTGVIIGVSLVFMLYSVISLFNNVEGVFNGIWAVKKERSMATAFLDYVSIIFLVPLAIILLSGLSVFFYSILNYLPDFQVLTPLLKGIVRLALPLAVLTLFITLMYTFLPNTKVRVAMVWFPAMLAGACLIGLQAAYIHFQVLFASYSIIYGSLAALPLLMLWLQLSWFICIGFAELGRANQELADGHTGNDRADSLIEKLRKSAVVLSLLCRRQRLGYGPCSASTLLADTRYSHAQLMHSLDRLVRAHLVARTHDDSGADVYTLNRSGSELGTGTMLAALLGRKRVMGRDNGNLQPDEEVERQIREMLADYLSALDTIPVEHIAGKE